eukprot:4820523-Prymnesium_polylepis.1
MLWLCPAPTSALRIPRAVQMRHGHLRPPHPALGSRTPGRRGHCTQIPVRVPDPSEQHTHHSRRRSTTQNTL